MHQYAGYVITSASGKRGRACGRLSHSVSDDVPAAYRNKRTKIREEESLTDCGILEDDEQASVVNPLYLEPAIGILPLSECRLDVSGLELLGEPSQRQDSSDACGELRERGCHCWAERACGRGGGGEGVGLNQV